MNIKNEFDAQTYLSIDEQCLTLLIDASIHDSNQILKDLKMFIEFKNSNILQISYLFILGYF